MLPVVMLCAMACLAKSDDTEACTNEDACTVKGSAMLQVRKKSEVPTTVEASCSVDRARLEPLTEEGFQRISSTCCYEDIKAFMSRLIDSLGLKVCDEGGLSGIAPFYSCPTNPASFAELQDELTKAVQTGTSKCHWLAIRYDECIEPALECMVSSMRPPPAPKPVASGFLAFKVSNPAEMMRDSRALDVVKNDLSLALAVESADVNIVIGSGPLDGEQVVSSFLLVSPSQAFISTGDGTSKTRQCKVFAAYSIQEPTPKQSRDFTTPLPTIDEYMVTEKLKHLDTTRLEAQLAHDLDDVDRPIGTVEVLEVAVCEKTSGRCTHSVVRD